MITHVSFFENTFLFNDVENKKIEKLLESASLNVESYQKGDVIFSPSSFERKIGFVSKGECMVYRQTNTGLVPLNAAKMYDSFGIISVFSSRGDFPTYVKANNACTVIFMDSEDLKELVKKCPQVSLNVINFLANKIDFLNDKIAAFSAGSIEEKLINHIISLQKKFNSLEFDFNKKKSAEALNCGRASLYRALDALEKDGYISFASKKIHITDLKGLERISK